MPNKLKSWTLSIGTSKVQSWTLSKGAKQGTEQDAEQGTGISTNLFLENSRNLANTQCCVDITKYAANKNTKWATAPQLDGNIQVAKVQSGCT